MWTAEEVANFYSSYASQYDKEIDSDRMSYPAPFKLGSWVVDHLTNQGTLKPVSLNYYLNRNPFASSSTCASTTSKHTPSSSESTVKESKVSGLVKESTESNGSVNLNGITNGLDTTEAASNDQKIRVLDLGCGTGQSCVMFFDHPESQKFEVIGVDATKEMLSHASQRPFHSLHCLDIESPLPFPLHSFDIILMIGVSDFIRNPPNLLRSIKNMLSPRGIFGITLPESHPPSHSTVTNSQPQKKIDDETPTNAYTRSEMESLLRSSGFWVERHEKVLGYKDSKSGEITWYHCFLCSVAE